MHVQFLHVAALTLADFFFKLKQTVCFYSAANLNGAASEDTKTFSAVLKRQYLFNEAENKDGPAAYLS